MNMNGVYVHSDGYHVYSPFALGVLTIYVVFENGSW